MPINYLDIRNGVSCFSQKDYRLSRHTHFPIEVVFTLSGKLDIGTDYQQYTNIQSAIINSNVPHTFNCLNSECYLYFIDITSNVGMHIQKYFFSQNEEIVLLNGAEAEHFNENHILAYKNQKSHLKAIDNRIQNCLHWINANYSIEGIQLSVISEVVFLSESRLAHLFKEQIGISVHQYILWKKIERAIKHSMEGFSLTDSAYFAGFADSSHFNKAFKKMFGIYPSFANQD